MRSSLNSSMRIVPCPLRSMLLGLKVADDGLSSFRSCPWASLDRKLLTVGFASGRKMDGRKIGAVRVNFCGTLNDSGTMFCFPPCCQPFSQTPQKVGKLLDVV